MERREIEIFLTLAEELHFGRTAKRLFVSQARVSQTIAALERRFGVALFERTSRHVALTPIGQQLREDVRSGHEQVLDGIAAAVAAGRGVDSVLSVGLEAPAVADLAADVLDLFRRCHPSTQVRVLEADFLDPLESLRAGEVDIVVTNTPVDEPDLVTGPVILRERAVLAVSADHPLTGRDEVSLDDLGGQIVLRAGRRAPPYWLDPPAGWTTSTGDVIRRGPPAATFQDLLGAVARGEGVCPVAAHATAYFARPTLAFVPFDITAPPVEWCLTWHTSGASESVRALARTTSEAVEP